MAIRPYKYIFEILSDNPRPWIVICYIILISLASPITGYSQHSLARQWNEILLDAIRNDFARPTVHARNLFHTSIALYDTWAAYDPIAEPFLLGRQVGGFKCDFQGVIVPENVKSAREEAMSFAAYRLLKHRFSDSPGGLETLIRFDSLMTALGFNINFTSTDYTSNAPAALGNYMGKCLIDFGLQDGSNELDGYSNMAYEPLNPPLVLTLPGNPEIVYPNRWQPLTLDIFIDQSGNEIPYNTPEFLGPEWGSVTPFALDEESLTVYTRDGFDYWVYHDPGPPPYLTNEGSMLSDAYQWGFTLVSIWSAHLDPTDGVVWDISPASIGNITSLPESIEDYQDFYDQTDGGDPGRGHDRNPVTGEPYEPQMVPRGDYTRVLAEFWADGPDSETPPGHWFTLLNYVNDHPAFEKRFKGKGPKLDAMEWDVKAYLTLGGAVHDAAITAWGIKGWYDYVRPISAIRFMADRGQSTDPSLPDYAIDGIPLIDGFIAIVNTDDPLAGENGEHTGKIKLYTWRGHDYIVNPETDVSGVGWILAENWWPYQRPSFVTPPFAGYVSGHSTFSRAAAEVLTLLTGDPFFPGGMGEFLARKNEFLHFEDGPSVDVKLQWATYRDASDQTSLSRIWGGIHPPADDIPGRVIGEEIGIKAFEYAEKMFDGLITGIDDQLQYNDQPVNIYPNPARADQHVHISFDTSPFNKVNIYTLQGKIVRTHEIKVPVSSLDLEVQDLQKGMYIVVLESDYQSYSARLIIR